MTCELITKAEEISY